MNIDDLNFSQARELVALFGAQPANPKLHPFIGRFVICRTVHAGVHAGVLLSQNCDAVILEKSRRLWKWQAAQGIALSGVAFHGLGAESKLDTLLDSIALTGVIETIPCASIARDSIEGFK